MWLYLQYAIIFTIPLVQPVLWLAWGHNFSTPAFSFQPFNNAPNSASISQYLSFPEKLVCSWFSWVGLIRTVSLPLDPMLGLVLPVSLSLYLRLSLFCTHWLNHPHSCQTQQLCQQLFPRKSPVRGRVQQHANGQTLQTLIEAISRVFISAVVALAWNLPSEWGPGCSRSVIPS